MSKPGKKVSRLVLSDRKSAIQGLRERVSALLDKAYLLEKESRLVIRAGLIPVTQKNNGANANKGLLDQIQDLTMKVMKSSREIESLKNLKQPQAKSAMIQTIKAELTESENELAKLPSYEELNLLSKKNEFLKLFQSIDDKIVAFLKLAPPMDKSLIADWKLLQTHCNRWLNLKETLKKDTSDVTKAQGYGEGIDALNAFNSTFNNLNTGLAEVQKYNKAVSLRDSRVTDGNKLVEEARDLISSDHVDRMKNYIGQSNMKLLADKIEVASKAIHAISGKDYKVEAIKSNKLSPRDAIALATKTCQIEEEALAKSLNELASSYHSFLHQISKALNHELKPINKSIVEESKKIRAICDDLTKKLRNEGLDITAVEKIRDDLKKEIDSSGTDIKDAVARANTKLQNVNILFKKIIEEEVKQISLITALTQQREKIILTSKEFLANNDTTKLSPPDLQKIKSYQDAAKAEKGGMSKLIVLKKSLDQDISDLNDILKMHQLARSYIKDNVIDIPKLIHEQLNLGNSEILTVLPQHFDKKRVIELLGNHLDLVKENGVKVIQSFIKTQDKSLTSSIQFQLDFIELASKHSSITNYGNFLKNSDAIKVALLLSKKIELHKHLKDDNLANVTFCDALLRLEGNQIPLTTSLVQVLASSESARSFVNDPNNSKKLIQDYLNASNELRQEFHSLCKEVPFEHQSLLLTILLNKPNSQANRFFLTALFSPLFKDTKQEEVKPLEQEKIRLMGLLKVKNEDGKKDLNQMVKILDASDKHIKVTRVQLERLAKNLQIEKVRKLLGEDTTEALDKTNVTLTSLSNFQREVLPILLNESSNDDKEHEVTELAAKHLSKTDIWGTFKEFVEKLFKTIFKSAEITTEYRQNIQDLNPRSNESGPSNTPQ